MVLGLPLRHTFKYLRVHAIHAVQSIHGVVQLPYSFLIGAEKAFALLSLRMLNGLVDILRGQAKLNRFRV